MNRYWTLAINYNTCVAYSRRLENSGYSFNSILLKHLNKGFKTNKSLSADSSRKLCKHVNKLMCIARTKRVYDIETKKSFKFKVNFITLTLASSQVHSDLEIKRTVFIPFMELLQKSYGMRFYVWRAERQDNGNIHFHLVSDKYLPWSDLRNKWNKAQNKLGYVDRFYMKHGHYDPNSTDVHSAYDMDSVGGYISKYFSKNEKIEEIGGRFYSCSHGLSQYKAYSIDDFHLKFEGLKRYLTDDLRLKLDNEYCSMFRFGRFGLLNLPDFSFTYDFINYHNQIGIPIDISGSRWLASKRIVQAHDKEAFGNKIIYEYKTILNL